MELFYNHKLDARVEVKAPRISNNRQEPSRGVDWYVQYKKKRDKERAKEERKRENERRRDIEREAARNRAIDRSIEENRKIRIRKTIEKKKKEKRKNTYPDLSDKKIMEFKRRENEQRKANGYPPLYNLD